LTVWTTEAFSPTQGITTGQILAEKVAGAEAAQTGVRFRFVPKKPYGKGGILDYLLTTGAVVPTLLPDLAFIDVDELGAAVQSGLVQPLDALLPPEVADDLYPFARDACTVDGKLYCLQFEADLDHAVYDPYKMSRPPGSWTEVLSRPGPYLFPAGGQAGLVDDAFLTQYLAVWPAGASDSQQPFLDEQSLVAVLQFYRDGASRGIFPTLVLDYHSTDDTWQAYLSGQGAMAQVSAQRYLADRARAATSLLSSIPAINGPGAAITQGWALALITPDPLRQEAVRPFLVEWLAPETNAAWNRAAGTLPTRQAALALWDQSDPYTAFLHEQLLGARPRPRLANYNQVAAALQQAVEAVLTGALTPEEAAAQVMSIDR
jgi:multiple sugar transport system substrate-binding protein